MPGIGGVIDAAGGDPTGTVPGIGGVTEAGGVDSTGVPVTGGLLEAGGKVPHSVTVTVVVTVFAASDKGKRQPYQSEVDVR